MGELSTYELAHFIPFTSDVYFRLFVRHNQAWWPAHIVTVLLGFVAVWRAWKGRGRDVGILLAACWIFVGYTFHIDLYANLLWAADYFGWAFFAQGVLLLGYGLKGWLDSGEELDSTGWLGLKLTTFSLLLFPLVGPIFGREWTGVEIFGVAPDPTVLATLGLVLMAKRVPRALLVVPLLWGALSAVTAVAMGATSGLVTAGLAAVAVAGAVWKSLR